jgi:hypothetical protein
MHGLNLTIENPSDLDIQNAHCNGWLHCTACSSLLLWSADGLIRFATLNCPGSWHDSKIGTYMASMMQCGLSHVATTLLVIAHSRLMN